MQDLAADGEPGLELGRVGDGDLDEDEALGGREVVVGPDLLRTRSGAEPRRGCVKGGVKDVRGTSRETEGGRKGCFLISSENPLFLLHQELTMADVAFVVTTVAVFALVAFIAKGVAKL